MKKYSDAEYAELAHKANQEDKQLLIDSDGNLSLQDKNISFAESKSRAFSTLEKRLDDEIAQGKNFKFEASQVRIFGEQPEANMQLNFTFRPEDKESFMERIIEFQNTRTQPVDWNYDSKGTHVLFDEELLTEVYKELAKREDICRQNYASHQIELGKCKTVEEVEDFVEYTLPQGWPSA